MRSSLIGIIGAAAILVACSDATKKLTKDEEQLLDAMMFLFSGIEDNSKDSENAAPWRREVKGHSIEFSSIGENHIYSSDPEDNRKMRQSKYVRYLNRISLDGPCLFHFLEITEFSKGDSQEDFNGAYSEAGTTHIFNLANAHHFELDLETVPPALIELAGPRVACTAFPQVGRGERTEGDYCENAWNSMFEGMDHWRFYGRTEQNTRRQKAMALIKKACPCKPY
jgi:hypothetical protein